MVWSKNNLYERSIKIRGECKNINWHKLTENNMYLSIIFLFHNESKFVLWANDSFGCTLARVFARLGPVSKLWTFCMDHTLWYWYSIIAA